MNLEIVFLGTGSAVPTAKKNHTGILVKTPSENILIDCGEGIQRQFKIADENPCKLTKILLTHWHADHALGLTGLLYTLGMSSYSKTLEIYGPKGTKQRMELLQKIYSKFKINIKIKEIEDSQIKLFENSELLIEALPMVHNADTFAYSISLKDKIRINKEKLKKLNIPNSPLIKKIQEGKDITNPKNNKKIKASSLIYTQKGKKIAIILDTLVNENAVKIAKSSDLLICESTFSADEEKRAEEHYHFTSKQAAEIAKKAKAKSLILTHLSQKHEKFSENILKEARKKFPNTKLAVELEKIKI